MRRFHSETMVEQPESLDALGTWTILAAVASTASAWAIFFLLPAAVGLVFFTRRLFCGLRHKHKYM